MRVINDKEDAQEPIEIGLIALFTQSVFCAFGFVSTFFAPIPVLMSHLRLSNPWPRVSALIGALVAIGFFQVPVPLVIIAFVVSLFASDAIVREGPFWGALGSTLLVSLISVFAVLIASAKMGRMDLATQWVTVIDSLLNEAKTLVAVEQQKDQWDLLRQTLIVEGPFLLLVAVTMSFWLTVGLAAHLNWVTDKHKYSANSLRKIQLPSWVSGVFMILFFVSFFVQADAAYFVSGLVRVLGAVVFIQGMIVLSRLLHQKEARPPLRAFIYSVALTFGFYVVIGLGVMGSFYDFRLNRRSGK